MSRTGIIVGEQSMNTVKKQHGRGVCGGDIVDGIFEMNFMHFLK